MNRHARIFCAAAIAAAAVSPLQAATLSWQNSSTAAITSANYWNGTTTGNTPNASSTMAVGDVVQIGANGTANLATGTVTFQKLRVGHNQGGGAPYNNPGTVNVSNGATINLVSGAAAGTQPGANAGLTIGYVQNGTLNIDGDNSKVVSNRFVVVGAAPNEPTRSGTVNITNGGSLQSTVGNIHLGDTTNEANGTSGMQGHMFVNGTVIVNSGGADLVVGARAITSTYTQTGGTLTVNDEIQVGAVSSANSSFTFSGGTGTNGGAFTVGLSTTTGANATFNGGALASGSVVIGAGSSSGASATISAGSVTTTNNFSVGIAGATNASATISGSALVTVGNRMLIGTNDATNSVLNQMGGTVNLDVDLRLSDNMNAPGNTATYNLSGGTLTTNVEALPVDPLTTSNVIGRRGTGKFLQTGGTANLNSPLVLGNREGTGATVAGDGLYQISSGNLNVNAPFATWPNAVNIAPNGTGELHVIGDDAAIDVNGNFLVSSTANGTGTLRYNLEAGELVSVIDVSGTATFGSGAKLIFDDSNLPTTQYVYDLLTATSIADLGIIFEGPRPSWYHRIVPGGNGFILQAVVPEPGSFGLLFLAAIAGMSRRRGR